MTSEMFIRTIRSTDIDIWSTITPGLQGMKQGLAGNLLGLNKTTSMEPQLKYLLPTNLRLITCPFSSHKFSAMAVTFSTMKVNPQSVSV